MNIVTSYFIVRKLPGTITLGGDVVQHQQARQAEYLECLRRNREHPGVAAVHLLVEGREAYAHFLKHVIGDDQHRGAIHNASSLPPLSLTRRRGALAPVVPVVRIAGGLPTYADFFAYANQMTTRQLTMVCNADVYLSPTHFHIKDVQDLFHLAKKEPSSEKLLTSSSLQTRRNSGVQLALALTRYESDHLLDAPFLYDYRGSHDAFIVVPPLPPSFVARVQHAQNGYKAENVVLHELQRHRYLTLNPTFDLRLVHRHAADVRQWFPPVDESRYGRAYPCKVADAAAQIREALHMPPN